MAIVRWDPFAEMANLSRNLDRLFDNGWWRPYRFSTLTDAEVFPVDIYEKENAFVLKASLPGVKPEDVDISVAGDSLTIKAQTKQEEEVSEGRFYRRERHYGQYQRVLPLPSAVNADKAEATYENGVLTLHIPKADEARTKQIRVRTPQQIEG